MNESDRVDEIVGVKVTSHCPLEKPGPCRMHQLFEWLGKWLDEHPAYSLELSYRMPDGWFVQIDYNPPVTGVGVKRTRQFSCTRLTLKDAIHVAILYIHERKIWTI